MSPEFFALQRLRKKGIAQSPNQTKQGSTIKRRTIREFPYGDDLWSLVEGWAEQSGFLESERSENRRLYRKGGLLKKTLNHYPACLLLQHHQPARSQ